jgi:hypothetical protein
MIDRQFAQKKSTKKKVQPITRRFAAGPTMSDYPVLLAKNGRPRDVASPAGIIGRVAFPFLAVLLGYVRRQQPIHKNRFWRFRFIKAL